MPRDKQSGNPRGFAFVMYEDQRSTVLAVDNLNGSQVLGRTLRVDHVDRYSQPKVRNEDGELIDAESEQLNARWTEHVGESNESNEINQGKGGCLYGCLNLLPLNTHHIGKRHEGDSDSELESEDPMAAYIRAQQKAVGGVSSTVDKNREKEERKARKAQRAVKRAAREASEKEKRRRY